MCTYTVSRLSYDPVSPGASCSTWLRVRDVKQTGGDLASPAPGPGTDMVVPTDAGGWLLQLLGTQLSAAVSSASASGPGLGPRLDGRLCAAVPKGDLLLVADTLPDDVAATYGGRDLVRTFIDGLIAADLDVDGDGKADAASVSLDWTAVPARIVGYSPLE